MHIAIVTDAWTPQINGVVTTLRNTVRVLERQGHRVTPVTPEGLRTVPLPGYRSIRVALHPGPAVARKLDVAAPDTIHIATEGPLGHAARRYCLQREFSFTTSYHTRFPEYLRLRAPVPTRWTYAWLRRFHRPARATMVPTEGQRRDLIAHGFEHVVIWSRGVDTELYRPRDKDLYPDPRPVFVYAGRVAVEKNIEAFLDADLPGSRWVIGDGPDRARLEAAHPEVRWLGFRTGEDLARHLAAGDVFVFPSRTDTFGLVMLEAMACGLPVAAYPVTGPADVVVPGTTGVLREDLRQAALEALELDPAGPRAFALEHSWEACSRQFLDHLAPIDRARERAAGG